MCDLARNIRPVSTRIPASGNPKDRVFRNPPGRTVAAQLTHWCSAARFAARPEVNNHQPTLASKTLGGTCSEVPNQALFVEEPRESSCNCVLTRWEVVDGVLLQRHFLFVTNRAQGVRGGVRLCQNRRRLRVAARSQGPRGVGDCALRLRRILFAAALLPPSNS